MKKLSSEETSMPVKWSGPLIDGGTLARLIDILIEIEIMRVPLLWFWLNDGNFPDFLAFNLLSKQSDVRFDSWIDLAWASFGKVVVRFAMESGTASNWVFSQLHRHSKIFLNHKNYSSITVEPYITLQF